MFKLLATLKHGGLRKTAGPSRLRSADGGDTQGSEDDSGSLLLAKTYRRITDQPTDAPAEGKRSSCMKPRVDVIEVPVSLRLSFSVCYSSGHRFSQGKYALTRALYEPLV